MTTATQEAEAKMTALLQEYGQRADLIRIVSEMADGLLQKCKVEADSAAQWCGADLLTLLFDYHALLAKARGGLDRYEHSLRQAEDVRAKWVVGATRGQLKHEQTWKVVQRYMLDKASPELRDLYVRHGEGVAALLQADPEARKQFKDVLDVFVASGRHAAAKPTAPAWADVD